MVDGSLFDKRSARPVSTLEFSPRLTVDMEASAAVVSTAAVIVDECDGNYKSKNVSGVW